MDPPAARPVAGEGGSGSEWRITEIDAVLADAFQRRAFDEFVAFYEEAFHDPEIMEDSSEWVARLGAEPELPEPLTFLLVAHRHERGATGGDPGVVGGIVFEYYRRSSTALLSYLVVAPHARRQGAARRLVTAALDRLRQVAGRHGRDLRGVFAETEKPETAVDGAARSATLARMEALRALGAQWIDVPYVQPALGPGKQPSAGLILLAFSASPGDALSIDKLVVVDFLREFYRVLAHQLEDGSDLAEIASRLDELDAEYGGMGRVAYRELPILEQPQLRFRRLALTLHFVTVEARVAERAAWRRLGARRQHLAEERLASPLNAREIGALLEQLGPALRPLAGEGLIEGQDIGVSLVAGEIADECPYFNSFEADLLAHRFQAAPPLDSVCTREAPEKVTIRLPGRIDYLSEGRHCSLYPSRGEVEALVNLAFTRFPETGVRVWHLTFGPRPGSPFDEYDVIKLLSCYNPAHEKTRLLRQLEFGLGDEPSLDLPALVHRLTHGIADAIAMVKAPRGGTIEVDTTQLETRGKIDWEGIFSELHDVRKDEVQQPTKLREHHEREDAGPVLDACCGIVTGIFDFHRMGLAEAIDTLVPNVPGGGDLVSIQRGTMSSFCLDPEMFENERSRSTIAANPYLILPHAVLLHNEALAERADALADEAADEERPERLESVLGAIERITRRYFVPNVFHYPSERDLYEVGQRTRGSAERIRALDDKVVELRHRLEARRSVQRARREFGLTVILALLSATAVLETLAFFQPGDGASFLSFWPPNTSGLVFIATLFALVVMMVLAFPRKS